MQPSFDAMQCKADEKAAQVAELVDAHGSGPCGGNTVEVRVFSWAPEFKNPLHYVVGFFICAMKKHRTQKKAGTLNTAGTFESSIYRNG